MKLLNVAFLVFRGVALRFILKKRLIIQHGALTLGSALVSLGVIFFSKVGLLTGGTAGSQFRAKTQNSTQKRVCDANQVTNVLMQIRRTLSAPDLLMSLLNVDKYLWLN